MGKYSFLLVAIVLVIAAMVNNVEWAYSKYGLGDISLCNAIRSQGMTTVLTVNMTTGGTTLSDSSDDGTSDYIYQYKVRRDLTQKVSTVTFDGTAQINSPNETSVSLETNKGTITATNQGGTTTVNASGSATTVTYLECYVACVDGNRFPAPCTPFWTRCTD